MKLSMRIYTVFLLVVVSTLCNAQIQDSAKTGKVELIEPAGLSEMILKKKNLNKNKTEADGYRVQIFSASGAAAKANANATLNTFTTNFPEIPAYIAYQQPNFKVRVGDCKTRLNAKKLQKVISGSYRESFVVKDRINLKPE